MQKGTGRGVTTKWGAVLNAMRGEANNNMLLSVGA